MPKQIDHNQRRTEIARAACRVIAEKGFAQTKLTDIAKKAACTTGTLTHYFDNKDEILNAATDYCRHYARRRLEKASQRVPYSLVDVLLETLPTNPDQTVFIRVWMETNVRALGSAILLQDTVVKTHSWTALIKQELLRAKADGQIGDGHDLEGEGELLTLVLIGLITRAIIDPKGWPKKRLRRTLADYMARLQAKRLS